MGDYSRFTVNHIGGITVIRLVDHELSDLALQDELHNQLMDFLQEEQPASVLLNFGEVEYLSTGIIGSLLSAKKRVVAAGGAFAICELTKHVQQAFQALNLENTVFNVYDSEEAAIDTW